MVESLLCEIAQALELFAQTGETSTINLRALPMGDMDRKALETRLGHGEVEARLNVAGPSEIWETSFTGVWWVRHFGGDERIAAEEINITSVPDILLAHREDARAALARLTTMNAEESTHV